MNKIIMAVITAIILAIPAWVHAQTVEETDVTVETESSNYGSYGSGSSSGSSYSSSGTTVGNYAIKIGPVGNIYVVDSNTELDPGFGGFIAFDYRFHPHFSAEAGVMATLQDGTGISAGDNNILLLGVPTFDLKYYFLGESRWDPYALLGFGFYALTEGSIDNGTSAFGVGANLGLGVDYFITEHISLGISAIFRAIALIESFSGNQNGSSLFPFSMAGNFAYHF